jgi:hypothetical protein
MSKKEILGRFDRAQSAKIADIPAICPDSSPIAGHRVRSLAALGWDRSQMSGSSLRQGLGVGLKNLRFAALVVANRDIYKPSRSEP